MILAISQGEKIAHDPTDDVLTFSDDEELQDEIRNLALGKATAVTQNNNKNNLNLKSFDAEDSYFSEDEDELA